MNCVVGIECERCGGRCVSEEDSLCWDCMVLARLENDVARITGQLAGVRESTKRIAEEALAAGTPEAMRAALEQLRLSAEIGIATGPRIAPQTPLPPDEDEFDRIFATQPGGH